MSDVKPVRAEGVQTCWSEATPGEKHATFSGHRTVCGESVIEAKPIPDSRLTDITCAKCGGAVVFNTDIAAQRAQGVVDKWVKSGKASREDAMSVAELAVSTIPGKTFNSRREGDSWNKICTDFLVITGAATEKDNTSRFVGELGLAVLGGLEESEYDGRY
ncbi:hypothetical protein ACIQU6_34000 [Streptomyces sp. NPDC090442]|uniref:hypothetical protein n=1 Tax=Streptomyces sp. NPDC090442 TaxID=3365962 RepID=UPI00380DDB7E